MKQNIVNLLCYAFGVVSGVAFLVIDPYKNEQQTRFNAWQSILFVAVWFAAMIIGNILASFASGLSIVTMILSLAFVGVWAILMFKSYQGQTMRLPVIAALADKWSNKN